MERVHNSSYLGALVFLAFMGCTVLGPPYRNLSYLCFLSLLSLQAFVPREKEKVKYPVAQNRLRVLGMLGWLSFLPFLFIREFQAFAWFACLALFALKAMPRKSKHQEEPSA